MTDFSRDGGPVPVLAGWLRALRWSWLGELVTPVAHVHTEREVREARRLAAQSVVERLTR